MPIALLFAGIVLVVAAARDTQDDLFALVKGDLTGKNNFAEWIISLMLVGLLGYLPKLKPVSMALLTLIFVAIFLRKGQGFFAQITTAAQGLEQQRA